jgi:alkanesulfonate monooxygenase SsuD/methylene tetrahydromethanopterin reductase-like flavin-dependent oxidoreductase (luciferase family)
MTIRENGEPLGLAAYAILNEAGDQARNYHDALELFARAERLGIEGLWVRQFHLRRPGPGTQSAPAGGLPSPLVFLAWLAARTSRLRLGTAAVTLPLESPLRVAEDAAVLDALSGGRVELGVANGGSAPGLAELFRGTAVMNQVPRGIDATGHRAAYRANLARLTEALGGARLGDSGMRLNPPSPGLADRIWEVALSDQSGYDTGARGNGVLIGTTQTVPAEITARAYYRGLARYVATHGPRPPRVGLTTLIYPAKDRQTALREAREGIEEKYEWGSRFLPPATSLAQKAASICLHYGTAEQITESILAQPWFPYATQLMVQTELFYASYAQRAEALELFARQVAPALGWAGAPPTAAPWLDRPLHLPGSSTAKQPLSTLTGLVAECDRVALSRLQGAAGPT